MQYFPLFVDTNSLKVLLVGAGEVASRKLTLLIRTEADIDVIAPDVCDEIRGHADNGRITLFERAAVVDDIDSWDLIYLATGNNQLNQQLALVARDKGIWVNVVDNPAYCRFITPSIVDRGRLQIAISTAGASPVFARELRARLESWLPSSLAGLFDFVAERRKEVQQRLPVVKQRRRFWEQFFSSNGDRFDMQTKQHFEAAFGKLDSVGEILLIDQDVHLQMLPLAALPLLQKLDVVYSNQTLPFELTELVRRDASRHRILAVSELNKKFEQGQRCLIYAEKEKIAQLKAHFPMAKHFQPGAI